MPPERFSHSSLATWRRCRYKYYLSYIMDYSPPSSIGQFRGTIGHACLGEWYASNKDDEKAIKKASEIATQIEIDNNIDLANEWDDLLLVLYRYFNWARSKDDFETLAIEKEYEIELGGYKLTGFIDGIVKTKDDVWIMEHKFVKQASIRHVNLDMQVSIYMLAATKLGYNPIGCMYNNIRMTKGGIAAIEPVQRTLAYRNYEGLKVIEYELINQMEELSEYNEKRNLKIYRNPTKDCSWDCPYYSVCLSLNSSGEADSVLSLIPRIEHVGKREQKGDEIDE